MGRTKMPRSGALLFRRDLFHNPLHGGFVSAWSARQLA
jgi:hypothetical protein